jgi:hypothetical protein
MLDVHLGYPVHTSLKAASHFLKNSGVLKQFKCLIADLICLSVEILVWLPCPELDGTHRLQRVEIIYPSILFGTAFPLVTLMLFQSYLWRVVCKAMSVLPTAHFIRI